MQILSSWRVATLFKRQINSLVHLKRLQIQRAILFMSTRLEAINSHTESVLLIFRQFSTFIIHHMQTRPLFAKNSSQYTKYTKLRHGGHFKTILSPIRGRIKYKVSRAGFVIHTNFKLLARCHSNQTANQQLGAHEKTPNSKSVPMVVTPCLHVNPFGSYKLSYGKHFVDF